MCSLIISVAIVMPPDFSVYACMRYEQVHCGKYTGCTFILHVLVLTSLRSQSVSMLDELMRIPNGFKEPMLTKNLRIPHALNHAYHASYVGLTDAKVSDKVQSQDNSVNRKEGESNGRFKDNESGKGGNYLGVRCYTRRRSSRYGKL